MIADPVGASNVALNMACCSVDARWVLFGFLGGKLVEGNFDMGPLLMKRIQLLTTTLKTRSDKYKTELISQLRQTFFLSGHKLKLINDRTFAMSDVQSAHAYMETD